MTATAVSGYTDSRGRRVGDYKQDRQSAVWKPKHASSTRATVSLGAGGLILLGVVFRVIWTTLNVWVALMVVITVTLLGLAGWITTRKVRSTRRKAVRHAERSVGHSRRNGGRRSKSPATIKAQAEAKKILRDQRYARRDEVWGRRKAAAVSAARVGVAKVRHGWSQDEQVAR